MMSSSTPENVNPLIITPISELIKLLKPLFSRGEFNQAYSILGDRERKVKYELENIEKSRNLEKSKNSFAQIEKLKLSDLLLRSERECEELKEKTIWLREEVKKSSDSVIRSAERYAKLWKEEYERSVEKNKTIFELTKKLNGLRNAIRERDQTVDELKCVNEKVDEMGKKLLELQGQKLAFDETIDRMRREKIEVDQILEDLRRRNLEASEYMGNALRERDQTVDELKCVNEKLDEMGKEVLELQGQKLVADENIDRLRREKLEVDQILEDLRHQNLEASESMEKLRGQNHETSETIEELGRLLLAAERNKTMTDEAMKEMRHKSDQTMEELRRKKLEAFQTMEELRRQKMEVDEVKKLESLGPKLARLEEVYEVNKKKLESLVSKFTRVEEGLRNMCERNLANIVKYQETSGAPEEAEDVNLPGQESDKQILGSGSMPDVGNTNVENVVDAMFVVHSSRSSTQSGCSGLPKLGGENLVLSSRTKVDGADGFQTSPGGQSSYPPPQGETDDQEHESKGFEGPDPILITGKDDEIRPDGSACTPSPDTNLGEKEKICENSSPTFDLNSSNLKRKRSSDGNNNGSIHTHQQKKKQIREPTHESDESLNSFLGKLNLGFNGTQQATLPLTSNQVIRRCKEKVGAVCDSYTNLPNFINLSDEESTDSEDDSCSDSDLNEMVDSILSQKYCRTWMFGVDMLKDFEKEVELCMSAVCVLYRQQIPTSKSVVGSSGGLGHFNAMSGCSLAEYLIDGDAKLRLRKSADEVKQQHPEVLDQCRRLAKDYWVKLFSIYCSGEDPFFKST